MSWQDVAAIAIGAVMFAAYLHYIHNVYPRNLTDELEKDYYTCYDIIIKETQRPMPTADGLPRVNVRVPMPTVKPPLGYGGREEHDPGDEQPKRQLTGGQMAEKRFLRVRREDTNEIVSEIEVTGKSENQIERIERGILMNMDTDAFILDDSALDCSAD